MQIIKEKHPEKSTGHGELAAAIHYQIRVQQQQEKDRAKNQSKNTLVFHQDGDVIFYAKGGKAYKAFGNEKQNWYRLLKFFAQNPATEFSGRQIVDRDALKKPRAGAECASSENRVRYTIQSIRNEFKIQKQDDFLVVNKGNFGIRCNVQFIV